MTARTDYELRMRFNVSDPTNEDIMRLLLRITHQVDNLAADVAELSTDMRAVKSDLRDVKIELSDVGNQVTVLNYAVGKHVTAQSSHPRD